MTNRSCCAAMVRQMVPRLNRRKRGHAAVSLPVGLRDFVAGVRNVRDMASSYFLFFFFFRRHARTSVSGSESEAPALVSPRRTSAKTEKKKYICGFEI